MSIQNPPVAFPSVEEIDCILGLPDLILRNLLITQSYHELGGAGAEDRPGVQLVHLRGVGLARPR